MGAKYNALFEENGKTVGAALSRDKLCYLLLTNRTMRNVCLKLCRFLDARGKKKLFHLDDHSHTWDFGNRYAQKHLQEQICVEKQNAKMREKAYSREVERRRNAVIRLAAEIHVTECELTPVSEQIGRFVEVRGAYYKCLGTCPLFLSGWRRDCNCKGVQIRDGINALNSELGITEFILNSQMSSLKLTLADKTTENEKESQPVDALIQPLPRDESKMGSVLFFLYIPEELRVLASLTFIAESSFYKEPRFRYIECPVKWVTLITPNNIRPSGQGLATLMGVCRPQGTRNISHTG